jgi:hypothetical protein
VPLELVPQPLIELREAVPTRTYELVQAALNLAERVSYRLLNRRKGRRENTAEPWHLARHGDNRIEQRLYELTSSPCQREREQDEREPDEFRDSLSHAGTLTPRQRYETVIGVVDQLLGFG